MRQNILLKCLLRRNVIKKQTSCLTILQLSSNSVHFYINKRLYLIQKAFDTQYWKRTKCVKWEIWCWMCLLLKLEQEWVLGEIWLSSTTNLCVKVGRECQMRNSGPILYCIYLCNISGVRVIEDINWGPYFQLYIREY